MSYHVIRVNQGVSNGDWNSCKNEKDELDEFIRSADSVGFRVDPNHGELVEDHFDVGEWPHDHFAGNKRSGSTDQNWHVADEQELLIDRLWILACKHHWS